MLFPGFESFTPEQPRFGESFARRLQEKAERGSPRQLASPPCLGSTSGRGFRSSLWAQGSDSQPVKEGVEETRAIQSQRKRRWVWTAEAHSLGNRVLASGLPGPLGISNGILEAAGAKLSGPCEASGNLNAPPCPGSGPRNPKPPSPAIR